MSRDFFLSHNRIDPAKKSYKPYLAPIMLPMHIIITRYVGFACLVLSCTSCFTKGLVKNAFTEHYVTQKPDSVKDAYLHNGQLVINFTQHAGYSKETNWHIAIAIDSLLQWHQAGNGYQTLLPKATSRLYKAIEVYSVLPQTQEYKDFGNGVVAEMHHSAIEKQSIPKPAGASPAKVYLLRHNTHFVYTPFNPPPDRSIPSNKDIPNRQNIMFLYYPDKDMPNRPPLSYIGISIEPRKRIHAEWLLALPFTVALDIATGPVQIFFGRL
jgi:hypothetical protein